MNFTNILTDADIHKLKDLSIKLANTEKELIDFKNHLANLWKKTSQSYKKTELHIKNLDSIVKEIHDILGEK